MLKLLDWVLMDNTSLDKLPTYVPHRKEIIEELMRHLKELNSDPAIWVYDQCFFLSKTILSRLVDYTGREHLDKLIKNAPFYYATLLFGEPLYLIENSKNFLAIVRANPDKKRFINQFSFLVKTLKFLTKQLKTYDDSLYQIPTAVHNLILSIQEIMACHDFRDETNNETKVNILKDLLETTRLLLKLYLNKTVFSEDGLGKNFRQIFNSLGQSFLQLSNLLPEGTSLQALIEPLIEAFSLSIPLENELTSFFVQLCALLERGINEQQTPKDSISDALNNRYHEGVSYLTLLAKKVRNLAQQNPQAANFSLQMILTSISSWLKTTADAAPRFNHLLQASSFLDINSVSDQGLKTNLDQFWQELAKCALSSNLTPQQVFVAIVNRNPPGEKLLTSIGIKGLIARLDDQQAEMAFILIADTMNARYDHKELMHVLYCLIVTKLNKKPQLGKKLAYSVIDALLNQLQTDLLSNTEEKDIEALIGRKGETFLGAIARPREYFKPDPGKKRGRASALGLFSTEPSDVELTDVRPQTSATHPLLTCPFF